MASIVRQSWMRAINDLASRRIPSDLFFILFLTFGLSHPIYHRHSQNRLSILSIQHSTTSSCRWSLSSPDMPPCKPLHPTPSPPSLRQPKLTRGRQPMTASLSSARSIPTYSIEDLNSIAQNSPSGSLTPRGPLSAKIDTVNDILRYDSKLEQQYGCLYSAPIAQQIRSQTMPLPPTTTTTAPVVLAAAAGDEETLLLGEAADEHDGTKRKTPITAPAPAAGPGPMFLDSPVEDMDIDIELHSAKNPRSGWSTTTRPRQPPASASAAMIFNSPISLGSPEGSGEIAHSLSKQHVDLRHQQQRHRSSSSSSSSSSSGDSGVTIKASPDQWDWRKKPSMTIASRLNAFAAPWPLPQTTPQLSSSSPGQGQGQAQPKPIRHGAPAAAVPPPIARAESNTLPAPPSLPLPAKPSGSLPPIFVKREAALLPQGMAQPHVAPMGREWDGENGLSGNDRRRRASEQGSVAGISRTMSNVSIASRASTASATGGAGGSLSSSHSQRPDKLVRLGEKLKQNANRPIM